MSNPMTGAAAIEMPQCERGIGKVIGAPESPDLIEGVRLEKAALWSDDRGYFLELARLGNGLTSAYPPGTTQVSASLSYPGTIKAFHFHRLQNDHWVAIAGMLQVALADLRPASPTFGRRNTFYLGILRPARLLIPPGVAHGYKVIGTAPAVLVYLTDRFYNPEDEGRLPYNHPDINYDWETQHK
jgi:dTDP-4-dehydrorhamnose 3,5-epimerase